MKTVEVVAAIIHLHGRILATQRGYGEHKGMWEFPGGKMEMGETEEEAIVREIREELNVRFVWKGRYVPWSMIIRISILPCIVIGVASSKVSWY